MGRWPGSVQTLRRIGLPPDAVFVDGPQLDSRVWEGGRDIAQERTQMLLEVRLSLRVGLYMTWAGHTQTGPEAPQVGPAKLATDASSEALADPGSDCPPAPTIALGH
jgi:hypothetical protein